MSFHPIRIRRVYEPAEASDGQRVLVDRLWPRGLGRADARLDEWCRDVAPGPDLRKWFGHDPARWAEFRDRYRRELLGESRAALDRLAELCRQQPVTLLYGARDTEHNHAVVLRDVLLDRLEELEASDGPASPTCYAERPE